MGAEGNIHIFTIKDLDAWEQLTTRFGVKGYLRADFLREGLHVAWEYRGDYPTSVAENIEHVYSILRWTEPRNHHEWCSLWIKEWVEDTLPSVYPMEINWWDFPANLCETVGDFLTLWDQAIEEYHGEYEVWT